MPWWIERTRRLRHHLSRLEVWELERFGRSGLSVASRQSVLVLATTGRRSGLTRKTPVTYLPYEDGYLIGGGAGGQKATPDWVLNLRASPRASGGYTEDFQAGEFTDAGEAWLGAATGGLPGVLMPGVVGADTQRWAIAAVDAAKKPSLGEPVGIGIRKCVAFGCFDNVNDGAARFRRHRTNNAVTCESDAGICSGGSNFRRRWSRPQPHAGALGTRRQPSAC